MADYIVHTFAHEGWKPPPGCPRCLANLPPFGEDGFATCSVCGWIAEDPQRISNPPPPPFVCGLDLGKLQDYTALTAWKCAGDPAAYEAMALERFDPGTPYPVVRRQLARWLSAPPLEEAMLVVDATGVGGAVVDELDEMPELQGRIVRVVLTGGLAVTFDKSSRSWHVSKRSLASIVQACLGSNRLRVPLDVELPEPERTRWKQRAAIMKDEFKTFTVKVPSIQGGQEKLEAWRERDHDDLILSAAVALWWCEFRQKAHVEVLAVPRPGAEHDPLRTMLMNPF